MAAAAVASASISKPPAPPAMITRDAVCTTLLPFKDKANDLMGKFESNCIQNTDKKDVLKRRMSMTQQMSALLGEYSRCTRSMLLDGTPLDFDLPIHFLDGMNQLMTRIAKQASDKMAPGLKQSAAEADKSIEATKGKPPQERLKAAHAILAEIGRVHQELKRIIAEFGAFFQPISTIPTGFFAVPKINITDYFLKAVVSHWTAVVLEIKKCIFAAVDVERTVFPQQDAGTMPDAIHMRKVIADAITFWVRVQNNDATLVDSRLIPDYLSATQRALEKIGSKMKVKELLDVIVVRIDNESDRFKQIFSRDPTPVRRVVQLGLVKSNVTRISTDVEVGLGAALKYPAREDLFPKLVMMLDFDEQCIVAITKAIEHNVGAALGFLLTSLLKEDRESTIGVIAEVYESYRRVIATCNTSEQVRLRCYVALRTGINMGMPHSSIETILAHHFHRLLKDSGSLSASDIQFRAFDVRAAVASFAPLLKDVGLFVRVYQHRLGSRLLSRKHPHAKLEKFAVDELTGSLGIAYTHGLRAMIHQYSAAHGRTAAAGAAAAAKPSGGGGGGYVAVSRYAWPAFSMVSSATVELHPTIAATAQQDLKSFVDANSNSSNSKNKVGVTASVHPLLSSAELKTGSGAGIFGNALQCSVLLHIAEAGSAGGLRANEVAEKMKMTEREAMWMLGTLLRSKVASQDAATGKYTLVKLEADKRVVLSSVWGQASRKAAKGASKGGASDSDSMSDDEAKCVVQ